MSKSFVINLGKGFENLNMDSRPGRYESFNTDHDLIVKGYHKAKTVKEKLSSELIIKSDDIRRYLYDVLKETGNDEELEIDQWNVHADYVDVDDPYVSIYLVKGGIG